MRRALGCQFLVVLLFKHLHPLVSLTLLLFSVATVGYANAAKHVPANPLQG